jgi:hypothetical protein
MGTPKQWTVLVWIAGDNNLDEFGLKDIDEMKKVGSNDDIDVVAQFDRAGDTHTRRYHLRRGTELDADLIEDVGETNTGDPAVAAGFFSWGIERWPSQKVLAVMWNHGSGIDEADIYARGASRTVAHRVAASPFRRALFSTSVEAALASRGIAYDDAARDFLDNKELRSVLEHVKQNAGRAIDVLGFDACLMSMVEVGYELRGLVAHVVGSEQTEPGDGWPYDRVLKALADRPRSSPAELSAIAVEQYLESYAQSSEGVTQSTFDLSRVEVAAQAVDALATALIVALPTAGYATISKAVKNVQRFERADFADLGDFCSLMLAGQPGDAVEEAAQGVIDALTGANGLVAAAGHHGPGVERATGAAVYLPVVGDVTVVYDRLDFATDTHWNQFLTSYREA